MKCFVDGRAIPDYLLARQGMNFDQPWPPPARPLQYRILLEKQDLINQMRAEFERAKKEEIADVSFHQPGDAPALDRWEELGFPSIEELFAQWPRVLEGVLLWLRMETLDRILPYDENRFRYVINSLDRITVADGVVCLEGRAYDRMPGLVGAASSQGEGLSLPPALPGRSP